MEIGTQIGNSQLLQEIQGFSSGMTEIVPSNGNDAQLGVHPSDQRSQQGIATTMMGNLQDICGQIHSRSIQESLDSGPLQISRQQEAPGPRLDLSNQGQIIVMTVPSGAGRHTVTVDFWVLICTLWPGDTVNGWAPHRVAP